MPPATVVPTICAALLFAFSAPLQALPEELSTEPAPVAQAREPARPFRIAVIAFALPADNANIMEATRNALAPLFPERGLSLKFCTFEQFEEEVLRPETDLVLTTAGHVRRVTGVKLQPIATIVGRPGSDANRAEGTAVVVRNDREELQTLGDLRGLDVAANNKLGFTGWQIALGEILKFGVRPESFFREVVFTGDARSTDHIAQLVVDRKVVNFPQTGTAAI